MYVDGSRPQEGLKFTQAQWDQERKGGDKNGGKNHNRLGVLGLYVLAGGDR